MTSNPSTTTQVPRTQPLSAGWPASGAAPPWRPLTRAGSAQSRRTSERSGPCTRLWPSASPPARPAR